MFLPLALSRGAMLGSGMVSIEFAQAAMHIPFEMPPRNPMALLGQFKPFVLKGNFR
jgi:hypothetical protein